MKRYKRYMDGVRASDTLRQRLRELKAPGKRPVPWKKYGSIAAALVLVLGLGAWGLGKSGGLKALAAHFQPAAVLEIVDDPTIDIAMVDSNDLPEPGQKTLGGYEVMITESGCEQMVSYYILPYIEYGEVGGVQGQIAVDWDIPPGATRRELTRDEIAALLGGEDAVDTHLDWGGYELTGWAAWYEDGSFWGAYLQGYQGPLDHFEFAVTAGQLPPTCIAHAESVTQEVRGLTVTADKYDGEHGCDRRVSFLKGDYGCRFDLTSTDAEQAELLVSRLVCHIADRGLALTYTCSNCGHTFPFGAPHNDPFIGANEGYVCSCGQYVPTGAEHHCAGETHICSVCGQTLSVGEAHTHPYDPSMCEGYPVPEVCSICGEAVPAGAEHDCVTITCPDCGGTYVSGTAHHCGGYTCPDCGVTIPAGDRHYHTQNETYTCDVCGASYAAGTMHSHQENHHEENHHGDHH